jgi:hypothetical protein
MADDNKPETKLVLEKKLSLQGILEVLTILGGLYVFGTGWEHRMTVVEAASAETAAIIKKHEEHDDQAQARTDEERKALWAEVRETNSLVRELSGKRK